MITRVVKLSFNPLMVENFVTLFNKTNKTIKEFKGCIDLKLMNDVSNSNVFFTISKWESEQELNDYRNSDFFNSVWSETKKYFNAKPEAWSLTEG